MSASQQLIPTIERIRERRSHLPAQLPLWFDNQRGTPNSFLRSALFPAIKSRDRQVFEDKVLDSQKGITVIFTGTQFNQEDLTVWESVIHLVRQQPLGTVYQLSAHGILKSAGMHTGSSQHNQLYESLRRLTKATVEIEHKDFGRYTGHLINSVVDNRTPHYRITVNKELMALYNGNQWTPIDFAQRNLLKGKPLAQALHAFYSTHQDPYPVKTATLAAYVGSRSKNPRSFKQQLVEALQELVNIGFLVKFEIDDDYMVAVERHGIQDSKARHLA